jgi:hypothetical protein
VTYPTSAYGEKSIGFIFSSNLLLGLSLYFLNPHQPAIAKAATTDTTMTMTIVVVFIPPVLVSEVAAAAVAEDETRVEEREAEERETVVTTLTVSGVTEDATRAAAEADEAALRVEGMLAAGEG